MGIEAVGRSGVEGKVATVGKGWVKVRKGEILTAILARITWITRIIVRSNNNEDNVAAQIKGRLSDAPKADEGEFSYLHHVGDGCHFREIAVWEEEFCLFSLSLYFFAGEVAVVEVWVEAL